MKFIKSISYLWKEVVILQKALIFLLIPNFVEQFSNKPSFLVGHTLESRVSFFHKVWIQYNFYIMSILYNFKDSECLKWFLSLRNRFIKNSHVLFSLLLGWNLEQASYLTDGQSFSNNKLFLSHATWNKCKKKTFSPKLLYKLNMKYTLIFIMWQKLFKLLSSYDNNDLNLTLM